MLAQPDHIPPPDPATANEPVRRGSILLVLLVAVGVAAVAAADVDGCVLGTTGTAARVDPALAAMVGKAKSRQEKRQH